MMLSDQCVGQRQHEGPQRSVLGWRVGGLEGGQWHLDKYTEIGD